MTSAALPTYKIPESVLVIIHTADLQVLLLERAGDAEFWQSVTGSKDFLDEPIIDTAIREVREETAIDIGGSVPLANLRDWQQINAYEIFARWRTRYAPGVTHNREHVFSLCLPQVQSIRLAPSEHTRFIWLPYLEAAQRCFSSSNAAAILQLPQRLSAAADKP